MKAKDPTITGSDFLKGYYPKGSSEKPDFSIPRSRKVPTPGGYIDYPSVPPSSMPPVSTDWSFQVLNQLGRIAKALETIAEKMGSGFD